MADKLEHILYDKLFNKIESLENSIKEIRPEIRKEIRCVRDEVSEIKGDISRYKGFVGGVSATVVLLFTVVNFFIGYFKKVLI